MTHEETHEESHAERTDAVAFWEQRYSEADRIWSGRVNAALAAVVGDLTPGRSLDLGCGEGGDVLWLAERGWLAAGIDLSRTAVARGREEALARGVRASFTVADLGDWVDRPHAIDGSSEPFDLVTASFLQSPAHLPRARVLRAAAARVAPGGRIVVVSHGAPPSWARQPEMCTDGDTSAAHAGHHGADGHRGPSFFPTPEQELADLALDPERWRVEVSETRERRAVSPEGAAGTHVDTVVVAVRQ